MGFVRGCQHNDDNEFSIELTYYYQSHFVFSIMSLFKFRKMLATFDRLTSALLLLTPSTLFCFIFDIYLVFYSTVDRSNLQMRCINKNDGGKWLGDLCRTHNGNGFTFSSAVFNPKRLQQTR